MSSSDLFRESPGSRLSLDPSCEVVHCNTPVSLGDPKRWNIAVSEQAIKRGSAHSEVFAHFKRRQHPGRS
jgi:hypothetical protein